MAEIEDAVENLRIDQQQPVAQFARLRVGIHGVDGQKAPSAHRNVAVMRLGELDPAPVRDRRSLTQPVRGLLQ